MQYLPNATSGTRVAGGATGGMSYTQLNRVWGFYFDSVTNSFIIGNGLGQNVVRWRFGESNWTQLAGSLGITGTSSTTFNTIVYVTLDPMGNMYVADRYNHRIQFFWAGQSSGITLAGVTGQPGDNATMLHTPCSVILDNQLNLYVADFDNHRVQNFLRY